MIDIGANLAHESFDLDREAVFSRAWGAGVQAIILTGSCRQSNRAVQQLRLTAPDRLYCTAGVHPHHASDWTDEDAELITSLAAHAGLVSLGECGLDYHRDLSPREVQRKVFIAQLELAIRLEKPVFLHQRSAHDDFHAIVREYRAAELRAVAPGIPLDRLMIETDAPYLLPGNLPRGQRPGKRHDDKPGIDGRRNEPAYLPWVARALAELRGDDPAELGAVTAANARRFFRFPSAAGRDSC